MNRWRLILSLVCTSAADAGDFRAGAAQVVINPAPGTPLAGYYSLRPGEGVLDDLHAKALVLEQDDMRVAVVICDLIAMPRGVVEAARALIEKQTGISGSRVLLAATHTHTAPVLAREAARDDFDGGSSDLGRGYTERVPVLIAQAVADAAAQLAPAQLRAASGRVENLAFNRRFWLDDGTLAWNPRKLDPRIVAPAGPHDPEVGVLAFDTLEKTPRALATWVNYAMHPDTTGGLKISADYPGACSRALASVRDGVNLVANGCCGNLNHRNVWWADPQKGPQESARLGQILAGAVSESLSRLAPANATPRTRSAMVKLPLPEITAADREAARATVRRTGEAKFMEQVQAFKVLDVLAREGRPYEVEVQVVALGDDVALVSLPGEIFVELGLEIKRRSPFRHTHLVELANGAIGYIPNRSAYAEGAYEVVSSRVAAGGGELLVEAAVTLLRELKP